MAPHGAGPTRKSHTKSRKGCRTCKRRHIRCDETYPQCKNCTKHSCRCDYMDSNPMEETPRDPKEPDLLLTPKIEHELEDWRLTGIFPFRELQLQSTLHFQGLSRVDMRLIHYISSIYSDMRLADFVQCTVWVQQIPNFLEAAVSNDFVMSALLAISATQIAWMTSSIETKNLAYFHRGVALKGLQNAIGRFSQDNSDAVLAASILLSWQCSDWSGWTSIMHGIFTVTTSMAPWKSISRFSRYIDENPAFFSPKFLQNSRIAFDNDSLYHAVSALQRLSARLPSVHPLAHRLHDILDFAQDFQSCSATMQSRQLFEKLQSLRAWLFWMPVALVKANDMGSSAMVLLSQLYTFALAIDSSFPELSGAAFGSLTLHAIRSLDDKLRYTQAVTIGVEIRTSDLDEMMQFPRLTLNRNQMASLPAASQVIPDNVANQNANQTVSHHSPYDIRPISIGSQPGTPDYPPPGTPGLSNTPPILSNPSFEDLSQPPSPFLHYENLSSSHNSQYLGTSPKPHRLSFDSRSLSGYEYSLGGESPAYSPAAYSPALAAAEPEEDGWNFPGSSPAFTGGYSNLWL